MTTSNQKQAAPATTEFANLDVLRATAVMLVLCDHLAVFFHLRTFWFVDMDNLGLLGVLMFFVHTCLVLMHSLERQERRFGPKHLWSIFMARRCFRIYPLSTVVVLAVAFLGIHSGLAVEGNVLQVPATAYRLFNNLILLRDLQSSPGHHGIGAIVGPLWTLPFEMQMYLVLPPLYILSKRWRLRNLLGLWLAAVAMAYVQHKYLFLPFVLRYVPCFLGGVIAYRIWPDTKRVLASWWMGVILAVILVGYTAAHGNGATFRGMVICLFLGLMLPRIQEVSNPIIRKVSHLIAKYSYGIYLTHLICIWTAFVVLKALPVELRWVVLFVMVFGLPALLYHVLEAPMIAFGHRAIERVCPPLARSKTPKSAPAASSS